MGEHIVHKTKKMICGHEQEFETPVPKQGEYVWCLTCDAVSRIIPRPKPPTVAEGRPRRLKSNPRSNNQYTKGRKLNG